MKERPIIFTADSVRGILAGTKTQTRRVVKPQPPKWCDRGLPFCNAPEWWAWGHDGDESRRCPYGVPGDRLWVREAWTVADYASDSVGIAYRADDYGEKIGGATWFEGPHVETLLARGERLEQWRSPLFMPRWASRITLEVTGVRVERVREITGADAIAEGVDVCGTQDPTDIAEEARDNFRALWDSINARRGFGWESNPWVWVVEFRRVG